MMNTKHTGDKPIKVLLIGPDLPIVGGQTVQAHSIVENFREDAAVQLDMQPINPRFIPGLQDIKYVRTVVTSVKYLSDIIRKIPKYDVVHVFSASYFSFLLSPTPALLAARLFRKKAILHYHSGEADDHLTRWKTAAPTIRKFDRVVTPSGYLVDVFLGHGLEAQAIFNVVDTSRFSYRKRSPLRPVFLSNRNLEPLYNVECALRAFSIIQSAIPEAQLIVAGEGSQRGYLEALAAELQLRSVEFLGSVPPPSMPDAYDQADVYLNSSNIDNMPNSIIEAFACGLPVVSTNAGGIPYIVDSGRNGLLVPVGDHEGLAREALRLFADPALALDMATQAHSECERYSWKNVRDQWVELYRELADGTLSAPANAREQSLAAP